MREVTERIKLYTFDEASPELKNLIRDSFANTYELYDHIMIERVDTLKGLAGYLDSNLDYSLSCTPERCEFIKIESKYDIEDNMHLIDKLKCLIANTHDCPFTGVCYDNDIIEDIKKYGPNIESLNAALNNFIESIHAEYELMLQDDYLADHCECNDYEFTDEGKIY